MLTSTATIYIEGRNFALLIERLKNKGVKLLKIKKISLTQTIITVKYKDLPKVFAICKNMWYNKLLRIGGLKGFLNFLRTNLAPIILCLMFVVSAYFCDQAIFSVDVTSVKGDKLYRIYEILETCGIKNNSLNFSWDAKLIRQKILFSFSDIDFVTVKKSGNRLIIGIISNNLNAEKVVYKDKVYAQKSGVITKLKVYSGRALKKEGDSVLLGEAIADGSYIDADGKTQKIGCLISYELLCKTTLTYTISDEDYNKDLLIAKALFDANLEDTLFVDASIDVKAHFSGSKIYNVTITYIFREG